MTERSEIARNRARYGLLLFDMGDQRLALDWLMTASEDVAADADVLAALAIVADACGESALARQAIERALQLDPAGVDACARQCALGELRLDAHDRAGAATALLAAVELDPLRRDPAGARARHLLRSLLER